MEMSEKLIKKARDAEFKACNEALHNRPDTRMEDLEIATVKVRDGRPVRRCANCRLITDGSQIRILRVRTLNKLKEAANDNFF